LTLATPDQVSTVTGKNACGSNEPIGTEPFRAAPWVASLLEVS